MKRNRIVRSFSLFFLFLIGVQCSRQMGEPLSEEARHQLDLLPEPVLAVAYLNVPQLVKSSFLQSLTNFDQYDPFQQPEFQEFVQETGFDPRRDIREVYLAIGQQLQPSDQNVLAIIRGSFDSEKLLTVAREKTSRSEIRSEPFQGFTLYSLPLGNSWQFCFPETDLLIVGAKSLVKSWLENYRRGSGPGLSPKIMKALQQLTFKGDIWFAMDPAPLVRQMAKDLAHRSQDERMKAIRSLQGIAFSARVNQGLRFEGLGQFNDPEKAQLFHDAVKGAIAAAKLALSNDRKKVDMLNKIRVQLKRRTLRVMFNLESPGMYIVSRIDRQKARQLLLNLRKMAMW